MTTFLHFNSICIIFWIKICMMFIKATWILMTPGKSQWIDFNIYVPAIDMNIFYQYEFLFSDNITELIIGYSWLYPREIMSHFLTDWPKLLWCNCSSFWWCSESNISHCSDDLCQRFTKWFLWWIRLHHHRYELNRIASMVISGSQYQTLTKAIFPSPEISGNILNKIWGGIKTNKIYVKNKLRCMKLTCIVRDVSVWPHLACIGILVSKNAGLFNMT